ncbi:flagellar assembly protein FliH [Clostridium thailandense]|uniref:flagellar assembly protein FliH n=1 Tax=Clostridium thailandense TaxID=2794346 RepID=UPI003989B575
MQSSYRVIKSSSVISNKPKEIITEFEEKQEIERNIKQKEESETNAKNFIDSYENLAKNMIENARRQSEEILSVAYQEAERLEKEAYEKAYNLGNEKGYNDGFNKAYEDGYKSNIDKALAEAEIIKNNADNILRSCEEEKNRYLQEKEIEIRSLIFNCVENILRREVKDKEALNDLIFETLSEVKNSKSIVIKSNKIYCEEFDRNINQWKSQIPLKADVFVIPDESIEEGSAIIERDSGKVVVSIDIAMEKLREIFNSVE